jgi:fluoroquinolone resistance protein
VSDAAATSVEGLLAGDSFEDLVFTGLDLRGADLGRKEFTGCRFVDCKAQETLWRGARLDDCRFERCDMTRMQPRGMLVHDVSFTDSKLMGVEWADLGQFPRLGFNNCVLEFASFVELSLRKAEFRGCRMGEANFLDADLREADFAGSELRGSIFRGCKLGKTDFSAATGVYFDPAENESRGAIVPIETAALLAMKLGLTVTGFGEADERPAAKRAGAGPRAGRAKRP